jgi:hypothetical protein
VEELDGLVIRERRVVDVLDEVDVGAGEALVDERLEELAQRRPGCRPPR